MLVERGIVQNPRELRGAWAGEIGQTQLMPSAYLMFATTPDGTGTPDLIHNSADALASTADFLKAHGWQPGAGLGRRRAELRRHPAMELGRDLRQDGRAVRRPAGGAVADRGSAPKREAVGRKTLTVFPYSSHRCPSSTQRALAPPSLRAMRRVAALAGLALTAVDRASSAPPCARRAGDHPDRACRPFRDFRSRALAFTLDEASLWSLTLGVLAGVGLIVLGALAEPEAALRLSSFASLAFGVGLVAVARAHGAKAAAPFVSPRGALCSRARRPLRLCGLSRARLARSDDRRLHDLSRHLGHGRPIGRCGQLAAAVLGRRAVDHAGLCLGAGAGSGPRARADGADLAGGLYVRAAGALRGAGAARARDPFARPRPPRRAAVRLARQGRGLRSPSPPFSSPIRPRWRSRRAACRMSAGSCSWSARFDSPSASLACWRCDKATTRWSRR